MAQKFPKHLVFSFDLESTGLYHEVGQPYITQIALIPVDLQEKKLFLDNTLDLLVKTPPIEEMKKTGRLSKFVQNHPKLTDIAQRAAVEGLEIETVSAKIDDYLNSFKSESAAGSDRAILLGKSLGGLDRRILADTFGDKWLESTFHYRMIDVTSNLYLLWYSKYPQYSDLDKVQAEFGKHETDHTALQDAKDTAELFFKIIDKL